MLLSVVPEFLHTEESLVYIPNNWMWQGKYSNGQASYRKTESYQRFLKSLPVTRDDILKNVPIKSEFLWINSVLYDFFSLYKRPGHEPRIDWAKYFGFCVVLILMGKKIGADLTEEIDALRKAFRTQSFRCKIRVTADLVRRGFAIAGQILRKLFERS
jgi:hypothetical protein